MAYVISHGQPDPALGHPWQNEWRDLKVPGWETKVMPALSDKRLVALHRTVRDPNGCHVSIEIVGEKADVLRRAVEYTHD